jgi:DNA-directed RNA polymerase alpha subunit
MVERIIELANIQKANPKDAAAREEAKNIIIPRVKRINELLKKTDLRVRYFYAEGFTGNIKVENDCDWDGSVMNSKSVILELYDEEFDSFSSTYVDLNYFDKSDEELFEEFKEYSIGLKKFMVKFHEGSVNKILELNKQIEELKNTKL